MKRDTNIAAPVTTTNTEEATMTAAKAVTKTATKPVRTIPNENTTHPAPRKSRKVAKNDTPKAPDTEAAPATSATPGAFKVVYQVTGKDGSSKTIRTAKHDSEQERAEWLAKAECHPRWDGVISMDPPKGAKPATKKATKKAIAAKPAPVEAALAPVPASATETITEPVTPENAGATVVLTNLQLRAQAVGNRLARVTLNDGVPEFLVALYAAVGEALALAHDAQRTLAPLRVTKQPRTRRAGKPFSGIAIAPGMIYKRQLGGSEYALSTNGGKFVVDGPGFDSVEFPSITASARAVSGGPANMSGRNFWKIS